MAITGRVLTRDGHPVPNTYVTALHAANVWGRTFTFVGAQLRAMTNERGEYRLDGLYAGEFFLVALPHNPPVDAASPPQRTGFGNTFYPGVASFTEAKSVRVGPGITPEAQLSQPIERHETEDGTLVFTEGRPARGDRAAHSQERGRVGILALLAGTLHRCREADSDWFGEIGRGFRGRCHASGGRVDYRRQERPSREFPHLLNLRGAEPA